MKKSQGASPDLALSNSLPRLTPKYSPHRIACQVNRISLSRATGRAFMLLSAPSGYSPSIHALSPSSIRPVNLKRRFLFPTSSSDKLDLKISARKLSLCVKFRG